MTDIESAPPKLFEHVRHVFEAMRKEATAETISEAPGKSRHALVYEGHTTTLFRELGLATPYYCVAEDTEILTQAGWRHHLNLSRGAFVLTYNLETGASEWQPVQDVHRFEVRNEKLVLMKGHTHSSLTTPTHRWPVLATESGTRKFKTTSTLARQDAIPCAAPTANLPTEQKYTDEFVELIVWFQTEGTMLNGCVSFSQDEVAHPGNCARIRTALNQELGTSWSEYRQTTSGRIWRVPPAPTNAILSACDLLPATDGDRDVAKVLTFEFINSLTRSQLQLLLHVAWLGDGFTSNTSNTRGIKQKRKEALDPYQLACALLGIRTSIRHQQDNNMWVLTFGGSRTYIRPRSAYYQSSGRTFRIVPVEYTGVVWCPSTPNGTWFARREGTTYFTGNSSVLQRLQRMGCIKQLSRGGGSARSRWELLKDPDFDDFDAADDKRSRKGLALVVDDMNDRLEAVEQALGLRETGT
jgi:hypothetical protein